MDNADIQVGKYYAISPRYYDAGRLPRLNIARRGQVSGYNKTKALWQITFSGQVTDHGDRFIGQNGGQTILEVEYQKVLAPWEEWAARRKEEAENKRVWDEEYTHAQGLISTIHDSLEPLKLSVIASISNKSRARGRREAQITLRCSVELLGLITTLI